MKLERFNQLLESTLGDVKPLLNEALEANAGKIQQFLKDNQDSTLVVDYNFGPKSATAAGKYVAKGYNDANYETVTTVQKLWELMKADNLDVGTTPGFGPKMAKELARILEKSKEKIDAAANQQNNALNVQPISNANVADNTYVAQINPIKLT